MSAEGNRIADAAAGVSWAEGAGLLQDANDLVQQVASDQWAGGLTTLLSAGLNVKDAVADPMAKLASWGLGWAIEFFGPLNAWLDWLTCDQEQLTRAADTWTGIAAELRTTADELDHHYKTDTAGWTGAAVEQYRTYCADRVALYDATAGAAAATANLINRNKVLLTIVRSIVRDLITDGVGKVISIALRYPPPTTFAAAGEIANQVVSTGRSVTDLVERLRKALENAGELVRKSGRLFAEVREAIRDIGALTTVASKATNSSAKAAEVYNKSVGLALDSVRQLPNVAVKPVLRESVTSLPERAVVEAIKEPTKYGDGRVDESTTERPAGHGNGAGS